MIRYRLFTLSLCCIFFLLLNCNTNPSDFIYKSNNPALLLQPTIVLLHGLGGAIANFKVMQASLQQQLPKEIRWLALAEPRTAEDAIDVQAESVFKQLKEKNISENTPLIFVGHSQGGLKAYRISEKYGKVLNIKGIVAIGTPWESTPLLKDNVQSFFLANLLHFPLEEHIKQQLEAWARPCQAGIEDMKSDSYFLRMVQASLKNNQVPIFAIAGKMPMPPALTPLGSLLFGTADNDFLVTTDSQLAKNMDVNETTFWRNTPVVGVTHFPVGLEQFVLNNPQVIQQVKTFIVSKNNAV